jgi:hypothetical protein
MIAMADPKAGTPVEQAQFYIEFLTGCGWTMSDIGRATGYAGLDGLKVALGRGALPATRLRRLEQVAEAAAQGTLERPKSKLPLDQPLTIAEQSKPPKPTEPTPDLSKPRPAPADPQPAAEGRGTLDCFAACRRDLDRIIARLKEHAPHAVPIMRPGIEQAARKAYELRGFLTT